MPPAARILGAAGWLAGMALVLDGTLAAGTAVLVLALATAATSRWWTAWARGRWLGMRLRWKIRHAVKTGGAAVERAHPARSS